MLNLKLLLAHFIADYLLQPKSLVKHKYHSIVGTLIHSSIHFLTSITLITLTEAINPQLTLLCLLIAILHFIVDTAKIRTETISKINFQTSYWLDQITHYLIILIIPILFYSSPSVANSILTESILLYLILSIFITLTLEIGTAQSKRLKSTGVDIKFNHKAMFLRWISLTAIFLPYIITQL